MTVTKSKKLLFTKAFEINGISPLPHYYEEIYTNQVGIKKLGIRGDENYLFYSINGLGAGYYEEHEMEQSAASVYQHFRSIKSRKIFFKGIDKLISGLQQWTEMINKLDFSSLSDEQIAGYFLKANQMHGDSFSYYIVSQPYRMKDFEKKLRRELSKRVATSRLDYYMTELATSEKPTKVAREELDWLRFLIKYKTKFGDKLNIDSLKNDQPKMYADLLRHFHRYKSLTLGDGNWKFDIEHYINNLKSDYPKKLDDLKKTYKSRLDYPRQMKKRRKKLIKELYLDKQTVADMSFLADIGHTRLVMRIDGWLPFVSTIIKLDIELSKRLGYSDTEGPLLNFMSELELINLANGRPTISEADLIARKGNKSEFLILNDHGTYKIFFGNDAGKKFKELVSSVNHGAMTELTGNTAVLGNIKDRVCVYVWGDDLVEKIAVIKKFPILITGQTRPSMMPIIRLAKGIVTDEGGITSHAAIVSRELGIPSVIGTIHATRVFHDGDLVELDADNGIVRKLK